VSGTDPETKVATYYRKWIAVHRGLACGARLVFCWQPASRRL